MAEKVLDKEYLTNLIAKNDEMAARLGIIFEEQMKRGVDPTELFLTKTLETLIRQHQLIFLAFLKELDEEEKT